MTALVYRAARPWSATTGTLACAKPGADVCPDGFARVLVYPGDGRVMREERRERASANSAFVKTPRAQVPDASRKPRWTEERVEALPQTSGVLRRVGIVEREGNPNGAVHVVCECGGGFAGCRKRIEVLASVYARDTSRPRSCKPCSHALRSKKFGSAFTDKGYANAREYAAKQKGRAA